jgi:dTMP kinase
MTIMAKTGKLIVFEGGEFCGKSTQIKILENRLREQGIAVLSSKEPGGTEEGKRIRQELLYDGRPAPEEELALYLRDREIHFKKKVLPALKRGIWVLLDRSSPSTIAYQHYGRGLDLKEIKKRDAQARQYRDFDLIILLDMIPEEALGRAKRETRFEKEEMDFHRRVRQGYLAQARENPERWCVLDASKNVAEIADLIWQEVRSRFLPK